MHFSQTRALKKTLMWQILKMLTVFVLMEIVSKKCHALGLDAKLP